MYTFITTTDCPAFCKMIVDFIVLHLDEYVNVTFIDKTYTLHLFLAKW